MRAGQLRINQVLSSFVVFIQIFQLPYTPVLSDFLTHNRQGSQRNSVLARSGRQSEGEESSPPSTGVDFSNCENDPETGMCCVIKEETVTSIQKDPILECKHKETEKCHYTYVTLFAPTQEEVCEENYEKTCQVTFKKQSVNETVQHCYRPLEKDCSGNGPEVCRTVFESSCSTRYVEKAPEDGQGPSKFVGDTKCEKLPVEICGAGCTTVEGEESCHDKVVTSVFDVPEETCDLNPQKICRLQTRLVPKLKPKEECTMVPQDVCQLKFSPPQEVEKPLVSKWCLDDSGPVASTDTPSAPLSVPSQTQPRPESPPQPTGSSSQNLAQPQELPEEEETLPQYGQQPTALYDGNAILARTGRQDSLFLQEVPFFEASEQRRFRTRPRVRNNRFNQRHGFRRSRNGGRQFRGGLSRRRRHEQLPFEYDDSFAVIVDDDADSSFAIPAGQFIPMLNDREMRYNNFLRY